MNLPDQMPLWIGHRKVQTKDSFAVFDAFTGAELAQVSLGGEPELQAALSAAEAVLPALRSQPPFARASILAAVAEGVRARGHDFVDTIVAEAGKPLSLAEAEVARAIVTFQLAAEEARRPGGELLDLDGWESGAGHIGLSRRFPVGVIAAVTPFNFPLNLVAHKVAPCLATGNSMVVKPALRTPLTAFLLAEVLAAAGVPEGQTSFVPCANEHVAGLVSDPRVQMLSFTGSAPVGWALKARCVRQRVTLELGGNAAVILHADADLEQAIPALARGAFGFAGQSCISVQRVLIHASRYEEARARLCEEIRAHIHTGDPRERSTVVGPMIAPEALDRIRGRIDAALAAGARLVHGGAVTGRCLEATVLENLPEDAELCTEEAFAPVATLHRYDDFDQALAMANASAYGLQAGVFTQDLNLALRAFDRLAVGGVLINQVPTFRVENMPYGGIKESGFGREGVRSAMDEMTEIKTLIIRRG